MMKAKIYHRFDMLAKLVNVVKEIDTNTVILMLLLCVPEKNSPCSVATI